MSPFYGPQNGWERSVLPGEKGQNATTRPHGLTRAPRLSLTHSISAPPRIPVGPLRDRLAGALGHGRLAVTVSF